MSGCRQPTLGKVGRYRDSCLKEGEQSREPIFVPVKRWIGGSVRSLPDMGPTGRTWPGITIQPPTPFQAAARRVPSRHARGRLRTKVECRFRVDTPMRNPGIAEKRPASARTSSRAREPEFQIARLTLPGRLSVRKAIAGTASARAWPHPRHAVTHFDTAGRPSLRGDDAGERPRTIWSAAQSGLPVQPRMVAMTKRARERCGSSRASPDFFRTLDSKKRTGSTSFQQLSGEWKS